MREEEIREFSHVELGLRGKMCQSQEARRRETTQRGGANCTPPLMLLTDRSVSDLIPNKFEGRWCNVFVYRVKGQMFLSFVCSRF